MNPEESRLLSLLVQYVLAKEKRERLAGPQKTVDDIVQELEDAQRKLGERLLRELQRGGR